MRVYPGNGRSRWDISVEDPRVMGRLRLKVPINSAADPGLLTPTTVFFPLHPAAL